MSTNLITFLTGATFGFILAALNIFKELNKDVDPHTGNTLLTLIIAHKLGIKPEELVNYDESGVSQYVSDLSSLTRQKLYQKRN